MKVSANEEVKTIVPYNWYGLLVFDDPEVGLEKEPFVSGVPQILYNLCSMAGIKEPKKGFKLLFSGTEFQGFQIKAERLEPDNGGYWYRVLGQEGWLCPALFKYFDEAPETLYIKVEAK